MFLHVLGYKMLDMLRAKWGIGWLLLFPLVLATAFYLGFGNMIKEDPDAFTAIPVALAGEEENDFTSLLTDLSGDDGMFVLKKTVSEAKAEQLLRQGKIDGFFTTEDTPELVISANGVNQTILSSFLQEYLSDQKVIMQAAAKNPAMITELIAKLTQENEYLTEKNFAGKQTASPYLQYFYALLGMACLYGSWISVDLLREITPNQSDLGARYGAAPVKKTVSLLATIVAALIFVYASNLLLIAYIQFVLKLNFGNQLAGVCLNGLLGSLLGVSLGILIGAATGKKESLKVAIPLAVSMISSFLGGLMMGNIKQEIEVRAPWVNRVNPASLISDGFYTLNNYGINSRFYTDQLIMGLMAVLFLVGSILILRRQNYASI